jgi:hypothetical protein
MSLTKNTVLGIAAVIAAGFAIYSYMEPTKKVQQKKKEKGPETRAPYKKKEHKKGSEESPKKKHNKKHGQGPKNPKTA